MIFVVLTRTCLQRKSWHLPKAVKALAKKTGPRSIKTRQDQRCAEGFSNCGQQRDSAQCIRFIATSPHHSSAAVTAAGRSSNDTLATLWGVVNAWAVDALHS